ncbi:hypothetical protein PG984_003876 [Apiospora sp. TS-2023a]
MASATSKYDCLLENDAIEISRMAPITHVDAFLKIQFMCTIRVPDKAQVTKLPPGLGKFPLSKVSDYKQQLQSAGVTLDRGVFFPMHSDESMWISFRAKDPFMVKIYAGGVNAVSGEHIIEDNDTKARRRQQHAAGKLVQDYIVVPHQHWLDGIAVSPDVLRQFEASPSSQDGEYSTKVLLTRDSFVSDLQFEITPHRPFPRSRTLGKRQRSNIGWMWGDHEVFIVLANKTEFSLFCDVKDTVWDVKWAMNGLLGEEYCEGDPIMVLPRGGDEATHFRERERSVEAAVGGTIKQETARDWHDPAGWESEHTITIPVHILSPDAYHHVTGHPAPPSAVSNICAGLSCLNLEGAQSNSGSLQSIIESKQHRGRINDTGVADSCDEGGKQSSVNLKNVVADPDDLMSRDGPFRRFRTLVDIENELQTSESTEA